MLERVSVTLLRSNRLHTTVRLTLPRNLALLGASMRVIIDGRAVEGDKAPSIRRLEYLNRFLETFRAASCIIGIR